MTGDARFADAAERYRLEVAAVPTENPGDQAAGTVQDVAPTGSLPPGSDVTVTTWGPPPPEAVPDDGDEDEGPGKSDDKGEGNGKGKGKGGK